jgi:hypothetical protein
VVDILDSDSDSSDGFEILSPVPAGSESLVQHVSSSSSDDSVIGASQPFSFLVPAVSAYYFPCFSSHGPSAREVPQESATSEE